jgi:hypothetical protein
MNRIVKTYMNFLNEGQREQKKIDELLDIMKRRKLTEEEMNILTKLSKGETLPEEESDSKPILKTHKTGGGYLFDEEGNVMTEQEEEDVSPGQEFMTTKGKMRSADKLEKGNILDARIYKNKNGEVRVIFAYVSRSSESGTTSEWIIYRTDGGEKYPFGQFLDTNSSKYSFYKIITPETLWKELDYSWDYGMVLDDDLYEDFTNFIDLYKENQARNRDVLTALRSRFLKLL